MDLILPEASAAGRIITCTIEGVLEMEDLLALAGGEPSTDAGVVVPAAPKEVDDPSDLKRVREKHHSVARLLASGMTQRMVASLSGYTESYLSILLNNPAMQELVAMYRGRAGAAAEVIAEKLRTVGTKALEKLEERLEAEGEGAMDDQALLGLAKLGLDRSGHGPAATQHVVNEHHLIDHAEIARLNTEARARSAPYIVPVQEVRQAVLPAPKVEEQPE